MSEYTVRTEALANASSNLKSISDRISEIASETGTVLRNTRRTGAEAITRLAKDTIMVGSVRLCSEEMKTLATLLETVAELYHTSERYVIEKDFKAAQEYMKGFSDDGFADLGQFDMTEVYLDGRNDEQLLASFHQKTRYNIRVAIKKGVEVKLCGPEALHDFHHI